MGELSGNGYGEDVDMRGIRAKIDIELLPLFEANKEMQHIARYLFYEFYSESTPMIMPRGEGTLMSQVRNKIEKMKDSWAFEEIRMRTRNNKEETEIQVADIMNDVIREVKRDMEAHGERMPKFSYVRAETDESKGVVVGPLLDSMIKRIEKEEQRRSKSAG